MKLLSKSLVISVTLVTIAFCFFLISPVAKASLDNKGTDFIMAFLPNNSPGATTELHLTSDVSTNVTIEYPVNSPIFTTTVAVSPGNITIVSVPTTASEGWNADSVQNNAVHAFSNDEFVAYLINLLSFTSDAALALPVDTMNTEYIVADYDPFGSQFAVIAGFDNTTVRITPSSNMTGHNAGVPFSVVLNRGQGYYGRTTSTTLTGTIISADRPVGLSNGNVCTTVPNGTGYCDHLFEVAQPVQSWGNRALVANLPNRPSGSIYRILASVDGTTVLQDGVSIGVINRGQFIETAVIPGNHIFEGDNPIYVVQYMTGQNFPGAISGDPAMGNMIPTEQYLSAYTFSTVGGGQFSQNFLTVIAQDSDVTGGTIRLDGVAISAENFTPIGTTGFQSAVVLLASGVHVTTSNGVHGITVEGYNNYDSYIFPGGALFQFINPVGDANPPVCNVQIQDSPPSAAGSAVDNRPTEDTNNNGILDPGEDLNGNGQIDVDTGIFFVELLQGAVNLVLTVNPFTPGDGTVTYTVNLIDQNLPGTGTIRSTDGAGNTCSVVVTLSTAQSIACAIKLTGTSPLFGVAVDFSSTFSTSKSIEMKIWASFPGIPNIVLVNSGAVFPAAPFNITDVELIPPNTYNLKTGVMWNIRLIDPITGAEFCADSVTIPAED